jgi:hypothetical protein
MGPGLSLSFDAGVELQRAQKAGQDNSELSPIFPPSARDKKMLGMLLAAQLQIFFHSKTVFLSRCNF